MVTGSPWRIVAMLPQGGITGYDTNTLTGGLGARYLGIGANSKWKLDVVTVSMRAVATNTGEVLASVVVRLRDGGSTTGASC
ncbi:CsgG/HfaB family protein [Oceaniglobus roseus]|uniref:CsgG/HfaB family protein n=1 Tax=Oceaniglobus roseus TaxID=1737570 RepID=UPI001C12A612|nr:CsgG/HfaB family protein [Kandeliimicrobium roseum]